MDLKGSLVDTNLKIIPTENLLAYLKTIPINKHTPVNIVKLVKGTDYESKHVNNTEDSKPISLQLSDKDIENLNKIKEAVGTSENIEEDKEELLGHEQNELKKEFEEKENDLTKEDPKNALNDKTDTEDDKNENEIEPKYLLTSDIDWVYVYLQNQKNNGVKDVPYLHTLLEGASIEMPQNQVIKRNPLLEARCVKLRAQQEAREYRKMTKTVDNVRMRFPEDSISYQLKQMNRQLIAIGQFIISIFAGFLFGFRGVEWMVGNLDFGFRLLLGVMCALVIALAEIYFLAKKLNEELSIPETVQLGGPAKFVDQPKSYYDYDIPKETNNASNNVIDKEHQD